MSIDLLERPEAPAAEPQDRATVPVTPTARVGNLRPGNNPRTHFDPREHTEMVESIRARGVILPLVVRPLGDGESFEIIAGERRWRGAKEALGDDGLVPIRVIEADDTEAAALALIENTIRANMSPAEEAQAASRLLAEFAGNRDEVARRLGWKRSMVDSRLALMNASDKVRQALTTRRIMLGHAELLAAAPKEQQDQVLEKLLALPAMIPVAALKAELQKVAIPLATACFDKAECAACPHNSDLQTAMFGESIQSGNCTNRTCYDTKTSAEIERRVEEIKDRFPRVQIVRPGDNHSIIKIVAEGERGVGAEQAQACRSCKDFGAAISAVPGKEGNVYENQCFNPACNTRMVAKNLKASKAKPEAASSAKEPAATKKEAAPAAAKASPNAVTGQVHEFRAKLWRSALATEVLGQPMKSMQLLVAMCLTNNASKLATDKVAQAYNALTSQSDSFAFDQVERALASLMAQPKETLTKMMVHLSSTGVSGLSDKAVCAALKAFEVNLDKHFRIDEDFLKLLTKSELEVVGRQVGLDAAMGEEFAKLASKKKDEMIKAMLAVEGFDYARAPKLLQPVQ